MLDCASAHAIVAFNGYRHAIANFRSVCSCAKFEIGYTVGVRCHKSDLVGIIHVMTDNVAQEGFCPFVSLSCYPDLH